VKKAAIIAILFFLILLGFFVFYKKPFFEKENKKQTELPEENTEVLDGKTLEEQVGQMLMVGFRGTEVSETSTIAKAIKELNLGGVVLFDYDVPSKSFPRNILNKEQVKKLTTNLQELATTTLFIAVDAEGGKINRLKEKYGFYNTPSHQELGRDESTTRVSEEATKLAKQLKEMGLNMNLAPVVDVNLNPENPVIGKLERSFSDDPFKVAEFSEAFIIAHQEEGIITVVKHFPGHGSSKEDSHLELVDITDTWQDKELIPYRQLQAGGIFAESGLDNAGKEPLIKAVMTAHIINKNTDPNLPATLSPLFLRDILREQIGFQGVIISDDMQMASIVQNFGFEEAIIKAVNAGCDILIFSNNSNQPYDDEIAFKAQQIIVQAVKEGKISQGTIEQAYQKIQSLKTEIGL